MNEQNAKTRIIETTIQMIEEQGYNKITTNHIARNAEVSIGTLYYHFDKGKPDIIKEIIKQGYVEFLDEKLLENLTIGKLPNFLRTFLKKYLQQHRKYESLLIALETAFISNRDMFMDYTYIQNELKLVPFISNILKQLGYPEKKDLDDISKFLLYSIDSIIHHHVIYGEYWLKDEILIKNLTNMILKYIKFE